MKMVQLKECYLIKNFEQNFQKRLLQYFSVPIMIWVASKCVPA